MSDTLSPARILLVEDEPLIGLSVQAALEEAGAEVAFVQSDRAAYDALRAESAKFDVLIADINLREGTTGFDVARYARRLNPSLQVVFLSGGSEDSVASFGVDGAAFVGKPVAESELLSKIARLVPATRTAALPEPRAH